MTEEATPPDGHLARKLTEKHLVGGTLRLQIVGVAETGEESIELRQFVVGHLEGRAVVAVPVAVSSGV